MEEETGWHYRGAILRSWRIMAIVKEGWNVQMFENGEFVPHFEQTEHASQAQIRVKFESKQLSNGIA